jgi:hypothetical protein
VSAPARHEDRRSLLFMNYIHARLFKRSLLVLSVKVAFTLLLPWIRRHEDFYRFTRILCSCTLLPSYAKMPSLLPFPHPMAASRVWTSVRRQLYAVVRSTCATAGSNVAMCLVSSSSSRGDIVDRILRGRRYTAPNNSIRNAFTVAPLVRQMQASLHPHR